MFEFISQHQFGIAVAVYWIYSAAVSSLPEPAGNGSPVYQWLYRFSHTIAGNLTTAFAGRIPGLRKLGLDVGGPSDSPFKEAREAGVPPVGRTVGPTLMLLLMPALFSASACGAHYRIHPGALNSADSAAYDALLIAQTTIDQARLEYEAGRLPADSERGGTVRLSEGREAVYLTEADGGPDAKKHALDALIRSYNVARASWLTYRNALATNASSAIDFDQLAKSLSDLTKAIRTFKEK